MFFSITKTPDNKFSNYYNFDDIFLNTDEGWSVLNTVNYTIIYKGYSDNNPLELNLNSIITEKEPCVTGNFCLFHYEKNRKILNIKNSIDRSYNLYYDNNEITNLEIKSKKIAADKIIVDIDQNLNFEIVNYNVLGSVENVIMDYKTILNEIYSILDIKVSNFIKHNKLPIRAYLSGGIDTMLVYSFIKKQTENYKFADRAHVELDEFWAKNQNYIQPNYWAYNQIHHWITPTVLLSGAPGDEFMLRSPTSVNLYLLANGINILDLLNTDTHFLHKKYFLKDKHIKIFNDQTNDPLLKIIVKSKKHTYRHICNVSSNDHQHHHLGNTITYTPLRDLNILKLCMQMPLENAIAQILNSQLSKDLIAMNDPNLLNYLTVDKNNQNYYPVYQYLKQFN
jgi:hypothetical protein